MEANELLLAEAERLLQDPALPDGPDAQAKAKLLMEEMRQNPATIPSFIDAMNRRIAETKRVGG